MVLPYFWHIFSGKRKCPSVKLKHFPTICILMCIWTAPAIGQNAVSQEYKAVFKEPCKGIMMANLNDSLDQFTVCTYIKLNSSKPWTAFTYKMPSSSLDSPTNIALLGDSSSIQIWMFGTAINFNISLKEQTWYELCIQWKTDEMIFYIDGILQGQQKMNATTLNSGGSVLLGCLDFNNLNNNSSSSMGLIGEMYMFRMKKIADKSLLKTCKDGDAIKWNVVNWIYTSTVVVKDTTLNCAKGDATSAGSGQISNNIQKRSADGNEPLTSAITVPIQSSSTVTELTLDTSISIQSSSTTTNVTEELRTTINSEQITTTTNFRNTTFVNDGSSSTITVNRTYSTTDLFTTNEFGNDTTSTTLTTEMTTESKSCVSNESMEIQDLFKDVCNSNFSCSGIVMEVVLDGNCTTAASVVRDNLESRNNFSMNLLPEKCRILVNTSSCSEVTSVLDVHVKHINMTTAWTSKTEQHVTVTTNRRILQGDGVTSQITWSERVGLERWPSDRRSLQSAIILACAGAPWGAPAQEKGYCCCEECILSDCFNSTPCIYGGSGSGGGATGGSGGGNGGGATGGSGPGGATTVQIQSSSNAVTTSSKGTNSTSSTTSTKNGGSTTVWSNTTQHTENTITIDGNSKTTIINGPSTSVRSGSDTTRDETTLQFNSTELLPPIMTTQNADITESVKKLQELLASGNLNASMVDSIVSELEGLLKGDISSKDAEALVGILNTFLNLTQSLLTPVSTRLITIVDKIGLQLTFPGETVNVTSQSLALAVSKANASSFNGTSFGVAASSELQVSLGSSVAANSAGSVTLPASLLGNLSSGDKDLASRVQFNYFAKTSFFSDSSLSANESLVSSVISSSVANISITNLKENVTVTLKTPTQTNGGVLKCVFWNVTKNGGKGGWSSEGCTAAKGKASNETVCKCNHLTSFAIILDVTPNQKISPEDNLILTFITYIGCGLSAIFLSVTLVTYIAFEKIRRDYPSKILIQLCAALICLNLTFLMNPWIAMYSDVPGLCISVAAFLHYFILVSITWMGLEAFHMYLALVKVFNTYVRKYILKFCIIGWGAPAVVVAIILAVNKDLYKLYISTPYPNGAADYFCWMDDVIYWITVVGYFCMIFTLNVSMFIVVLVQLCRIKKQKQLGFQRKTTLQDMRSVAGITFLLGITWGLGFFSFGPGKVVIQYLFTICNTLQGFFIFFFYCVAKENVRKQWRRYLCCGKFRLAENSDWSKTATNKLRQQTSKQGISSSSSNSIQSTSNSNSTTLLVANDYAMHPNGNGHLFKERNGVSFMHHNGAVQLEEFPERPQAMKGDIHQTSLRRTSKRGSVHFVDQM